MLSAHNMQSQSHDNIQGHAVDVESRPCTAKTDKTDCRDGSDDDSIDSRPDYVEKSRITNNVRDADLVRCLWTWTRKNTLYLYFCGAVVVLIANITWAIWAHFRYETSTTEVDGASDMWGVQTIFRGDCGKAGSINLWLHFLVNVLSTILLTGSNAFCTSFNSPSVSELEEAHTKGNWLHIGIFDLGNLRKISRGKMVACLVLLFSSVPFALLCVISIWFTEFDLAKFALTIMASYNTLIFQTKSANAYEWAIVGPPGISSNGTLNSGIYRYFEPFKQYTHNPNSFELLGARECLSAYSTTFLQHRSSLLLFSTTGDWQLMRSGSWGIEPDNLHLWYSPTCLGKGPAESGCVPNLFSVSQHTTANPLAKESTCSGSTSPYEAKCYETVVQLGHLNIAYCLSKTTHSDNICSVQYSWTVMAIVLGCNVIKTCSMLFILWRFDFRKLIMSLGDAIEIFLMKPELRTAGSCLLDRTDIEISKSFGRIEPKRWVQKRFRGSEAVSESQGISFTLLVFAVFGLALFWTTWGFTSIEGESLDPLSLAFDEIVPAIFWFRRQAPISFLSINAVANLPQLLLSMIYFIYANFLSSIFWARHWNRFGSKDTRLMVSSPKVGQEEIWLFNMPFWIGLSAQAFQTALHWLLSQAIFPVRIELLDPGFRRIQTPSLFNNGGYSPAACLLSLVASVVLFVVIVVFAQRKLKPGGPPVVGTNSLAIAAACNFEGWEPEMALGKLRWGEVSFDQASGVGHCSFAPATGRVYPPIEDRLYA